MRPTVYVIYAAVGIVTTGDTVGYTEYHGYQSTPFDVLTECMQAIPTLVTDWVRTLGVNDDTMVVLAVHCQQLIGMSI